MTKNKITLTQNFREWQDAFSQFKEILLLKSTTKLPIEHIGSTAIPDIVAKDIIDVQIGVEDLENIDELEKILNKLGFKMVAEIKQDHVPLHEFDYIEPGWEKRFFRGDFNDFVFHLHIRKYNQPNWQYAIYLRDYLKSHPEVLTLYQQIKTRLAAANIDRKHYTLIKDPIFDLIYLLAKSKH